MFDAYGTVEPALVIKDKFSGRSRGFGFVEMSTSREAVIAIAELNGLNEVGEPCQSTRRDHGFWPREGVVPVIVVGRPLKILWKDLAGLAVPLC